MGLTAAVQEQIRRFVDGQVSADDLSDWLDAHAQQVLDSGKTEARRLMDLTFSLLEDEVQGNRCQLDVREFLASEVPLVQAVTFDPMTLATTVSSTGTVATRTEVLGSCPTVWTPDDSRTESPVLLPY